MRILLIEDTPEKRSSIRNAIEEVRPPESDWITDEIDNLSSAIRLVAQNDYDLIVLDLILPYYDRGTPQADAGIALLREIRTESGRNKHAVVIAISAFPAELASARRNFEDFGVLIVEYEQDKSWKNSLQHVVSDVLARRKGEEKLDFIVVVAIPEECEGLRATGLTFGTSCVRSGLNVTFVELKNVAATGAIIQLRAMGLVPATLDTVTAISTFRPDVVCMAGICAGIAGEVTVGQLVLASPVWEYQSGKWAQNDFQIAPYQVPLRPTTRVIAEQVLDGLDLNALESGIEMSVLRPSLRVKPMIAPGATGSAVIADRARLSHIEKQHRKLAVVDMETYGVYAAAHESSRYVSHFFSVKCVVDLADKAKGDDLHRYGAIVSGRAAEAILVTLYSDRNAAGLPSGQHLPST